MISLYYCIILCAHSVVLNDIKITSIMNGNLYNITTVITLARFKWTRDEMLSVRTSLGDLVAIVAGDSAIR